MHNLAQKIEAILFVTAEPQSFKSLSARFEVSLAEIQEAVRVLAERLSEKTAEGAEGSALMVAATESDVALVTRPEFSSLIETLQKEAVSKELTKASAETLSIVVYQPGISRGEIEFIRGVNATYSLRSLMMRGLIEQKSAGRSTQYFPTVQFLESLGIASADALPDYAATTEKIKNLLMGATVEGGEVPTSGSESI